MKLKLVVAMSALGLMSCPVIAATQTTHKHHHKHQQTAIVSHNLKGEEMVMAAPVVNDWYNRFSIDGGINVDTKWGARDLGYQGENSQRISVNDANLNVKADINDWAKAFASLSYDNASQVLPGAVAYKPLAPALATKRPLSGKYDNIKDSNGGMNLEQGYITLANASQMPVYVKLGKQFVNFGTYKLHPLTQPVTQVLTETLRNAVEAGFDTSLMGSVGLIGSLYVFDNPYKQSNKGHSVPNYGGRLGIGQTNDQLGWNLSADYLYNFIGVQGVAYSVGLFNSSNVNGQVGNNGFQSVGTYVNRVGAGALNANINSGPFTVAAHYVVALQRFNSADLTNKAVVGANGAKPWAADLSVGYNFNYLDKGQSVLIGYQGTEDSVNLFLPRQRWVVGYNVDVLKNANVGVELDHDIAYSSGDGSTGNSNNEVGLRVAVKFG
jgi:hypothetical protein